jgi:hypothetical protein
VFSALWDTARKVASIFEFADKYENGGVTNPVQPGDLVSYGQEVIMTYMPDDFSFLVPTLKRDMLNEAERLMRQAGWEYDRDAKRWYRRSDDVAADAPWLFGSTHPLYVGKQNSRVNDQEADLFVKYEDRYPALVALARNNGNVTHAHQDLGVAKNTFYRRLERERFEAANDAEFMAALKGAL